MQAIGESDPQLADLYHQRKIAVVISEDSDMVALYGTKCLYKLKKNGNCVMIDANDLQLIPALNGLTNEQILDICLLCGCDFVKRIPGVGVQKALQIIKKHRAIEQYLRSITSSTIPNGWGSFVHLSLLIINNKWYIVISIRLCSIDRKRPQVHQT